MPMIPARTTAGSATADSEGQDLHHVVASAATPGPGRCRTSRRAARAAFSTPSIARSSRSDDARPRPARAPSRSSMSGPLERQRAPRGSGRAPGDSRAIRRRSVDDAQEGRRRGRRRTAQLVELVDLALDRLRSGGSSAAMIASIRPAVKPAASSRPSSCSWSISPAVGVHRRERPVVDGHDVVRADDDVELVPSGFGVRRARPRRGSARPVRAGGASGIVGPRGPAAGGPRPRGRRPRPTCPRSAAVAVVDVHPEQCGRRAGPAPRPRDRPRGPRRSRRTGWREASTDEGQDPGWRGRRRTPARISTTRIDRSPSSEGGE